MTRYLFYSHDSYGLGHFRRSSSLATALMSVDPESEVLLVTGSPRAQAFRLPAGIDTIKLPTATKDEAGGYRARKLRCGIDDLVRLRSTVVTAAALSYEPDVIVVDHSPIGMAGELRPLLDRWGTGARRPRLVLGLRDIIDDAGVVSASWTRDGVWDYLDCYDQIAVYGDRQVLTTADELRLGKRCTAEVVTTGYLAPKMPEPVGDDPFVLVTAGGGGDGHDVIRAYLAAVEAGAVGALRSVIVTGPLMSTGRRAELLRRADALSNVEIHDFSPHLRSLIASAVGVVSMAGYNTVVEELAARVPALLVPRHTPRAEQRLRAERLAPHSALESVRAEHLTPTRLYQFAERCLADKREPTSIDLRGLDRMVGLLSERTMTHA